MQFSPRLTGASGSPWVATILPFWTPTSTEQPVPQKRQAALSQRTSVLLPSVAALATIGMLMPAEAAAAATALVLMNSRRSMVMIKPPVIRDRRRCIRKRGSDFVPGAPDSPR